MSNHRTPDAGLLSATIQRLHTSDAPARFETAFGRPVTLRAFTLLLACCDTPERLGARARIAAVAERFSLSFADAGVVEAVDIFEGLLMASADDGDVGGPQRQRQRSKGGRQALCVLLSCLILDEVESAPAPTPLKLDRLGAQLNKEGTPR